MTLEILIDRYASGNTQVLGKLYVLSDGWRTVFSCDTLELPWKNNQVKISHIPIGTYNVEKRWSKKFKWHFHITNTPGRSYILIHSGNFYTQIEGCILVGADLKDINKDGHLDVINSKATMAMLLKIMPEKFTLKIIESWRK